MKRKMMVGAVLLSLGMTLAGCADFYALQWAKDLTENREREDAARTGVVDTVDVG